MKLFIINGPNLDMLGIREPEIYGKESYADLEHYLHRAAGELGLQIEVFQSNHEGALIDEVHRAYFEGADGIIINAGGYTHTSIALMDALLSVSLPVIEVHLSDPSRREEFRHRSYVAMAAKASVVGLGFAGYRRAMELLKTLAGGRHELRSCVSASPKRAAPPTLFPFGQSCDKINHRPALCRHFVKRKEVPPMAILTTRPRGTNDFLPAETPRWQYVERTLLSTAALYGYGEIRTPTFEHTELFLRGVGDTTDVVNKEMYTFTDKGDRSVTLRPEGTSGICRAAIENGLLGDALPLKVSYVFNCFRYEKAQRGRFRQFHQFGVECYGATGPVTDAEVISLAWEGMQTLGLKDLTLAVNSIGCPTCRAEYHKALRAYFEGRREELCETCRERLEKNPMRILDCKSSVCGEIAKGAPRVLDYLCGDCRDHFEKVQTLLKDADIPFTIDAGIVRGLDYYTRTVFEISVPGFPALCGGGRYGGLSRQLGGPDVEGIGFAMGLERLIMVMEQQGCDFPEPQQCDLYIASMGEAAAEEAFRLTTQLRREGYAVQCDLMGRSVKAQMKYANKIGALYSMVLGDSELQSGSAQLKQMATGTAKPVSLAHFLPEFETEMQNGWFAAAAEAAEKIDR